MKKGLTPHPEKPRSSGPGWRGAAKVYSSRKPRASVRGAGFTLIEMMVVVALVSILSTILVPLVGNFILKGKMVRAQADLKILQTSMLSYRSDVGELPPRGDFYTGAGTYAANQLGNVNAALLNSDGAGWAGPYLNSSMGLDPWSHSYLYDDNDNLTCFNSDTFIASWGPNGVNNTGWFPCCNEPGCNAGSDDIVLTAYNDND